MEFSFLQFLSLVGAIGLFIYGMKVMSDGIQKAAGDSLRNFLGTVTSNRWLGLATGLVITSLIQSSSATTVMVVSFVNAGMLTLAESLSLIFGANIGTTITGWLVSVLGLGKLNISSFSLPLLAIGIPLLFSYKGKLKSLGEFAVGFALLFLGLSFIRMNVPDLQSNPQALEFLKNAAYIHASLPIKWSILLGFVVVGTLLAIVVQSSSVAMAITLVMTAEGWIPLELAMAIILGENIGTTVTANLAALVGNVHAMRAARLHLLFNVFGVSWMVFLIPFISPWVQEWSLSIMGSGSAVATTDPVALAMFHTLFNVANVLIFINFPHFLTRMATKLVPARPGREEDFKLQYIGGGLMDTPELSIVEARKELVLLAKNTHKAYQILPKLLNEVEERKVHQYVSQVQSLETITDRMEVEIANYLAKTSENELSAEASARVRAMISAANYMERMADLILKISMNLEKRKQEKAYFTPELRSNIHLLMVHLDEAISYFLGQVDKDPTQIRVAEARQLEDQINVLHKQLRKEYLKNLEKGKFKAQSGLYYHDMLNELERIADHVMSATEALAGLDQKGT